jgi:hypothetical protein
MDGLMQAQSNPAANIATIAKCIVALSDMFMFFHISFNTLNLSVSLSRLQSQGPFFCSSLAKAFMISCVTSALVSDLPLLTTCSLTTKPGVVSTL